MTSLCILGDSIAKGVVFNEQKQKYIFAPESFDKLIAEKTGAAVKNWAKFGCTTDKGLSILEKVKAELPGHKSCLLEFGGNDCDLNWSEISENPRAPHIAKVPLDDFKAKYEKIIGEIKKSGVRPIVLTLPPLEPNRFFNWISKGLSKHNIMEYLNFDVQSIYDWHEMYNQSVIEVAENNKVDIINISSAFLTLGNYSEYICIDGMHPNEAGHKIIAEHCKSVLHQLSIF